jgi:putative transposase
VKRKPFSVEQIVGVLKQAEVGVPVAELIRQVGITEQTLYRWKKQYKGLETDQVVGAHQKTRFFGRAPSWIRAVELGRGA